MHDCDELQNRIWDAVEAGDVSPDLLESIGDCNECVRQLALAKSVLEGFDVLRCADAPEVPHEAYVRNRSPWNWVKTALAVGTAAAVIAAVVVTGNVERKQVGKPVTKQVRMVQRSLPVTPSKEVKQSPLPVVHHEPAPIAWTAQNKPDMKRPIRKVLPIHRAVQVAYKQPPAADREERAAPVEFRADESREVETVVVQGEGGYFVKALPDARVVRSVEPVDDRIERKTLEAGI